MRRYTYTSPTHHYGRDTCSECETQYERRADNRVYLKTAHA